MPNLPRAAATLVFFHNDGRAHEFSDKNRKVVHLYSLLAPHVVHFTELSFLQKLDRHGGRITGILKISEGIVAELYFDFLHPALTGKRLRNLFNDFRNDV